MARPQWAAPRAATIPAAPGPVPEDCAAAQAIFE